MFALTPNAEIIVFEPAAEAYHEFPRYKVADGGTYAYPVSPAIASSSRMRTH